MHSHESTNRRVSIAVWGTLGVALLLAVSGSWLAVNGIVSPMADFALYLYELVLVLILGGICLIRKNKASYKWIEIIAAVGVFIITIESWRHANDTFVFWKMRTVKESNWRQMISDLRDLDWKMRASGDSRIHKDQVPTSFGALGLPTDCLGGAAGLGTEPSVLYGVKDRRWGLVIGSNAFTHGNWKYFKRVQVGPDAWFFCGPDY